MKQQKPIKALLLFLTILGHNLPSKAQQAKTLTVDGISYYIDILNNGSYDKNQSLLQTQAWWNNAPLAQKLSSAYGPYQYNASWGLYFTYGQGPFPLVNAYKNGNATQPGQFVTQNEYAISTKLPVSVVVNPVTGNAVSGGGGNPNINSTAGLVIGTYQSIAIKGVSQPLPIGIGQGVSSYIVSSSTGSPTIAGATANADFNGVLNVVNSLPTQAAVNNSYEQIIAEPYASFVSIGLETLARFRRNALALAIAPKSYRFTQQVDICTDSSASQASTTNKKLDCNRKTLTKELPWALLIDTNNTQSALRGTNNLASLNYNIFQSTYGLEYSFNSQWALGAAFGYGQSNLYNYEYSGVKINANNYTGAIYGLYNPSSNLKIVGLGGFTSFQNNSNRPIQFGSIDRTAMANWNASGYTLALTAEYGWLLNPTAESPTASNSAPDRNGIRIKPKALISYANYNQEAISESGANSLDLKVNSHGADSLIFGLGLTLETPIVLSKDNRLIPRLSVAYQYDAMGDVNEEHQLQASFKTVSEPGSLTLIGQNRGTNDVEVALNLEYEAGQNISVYGGAGAAFWSNGNELSYGGGVRYRW